MKPVWIQSNSKGNIVFWDKGTRQVARMDQFFKFAGSDTYTPNLPKFEDQLDHYLHSKRTESILSAGRFQGLWDKEGTFWTYRSEQTDTATSLTFFQPFSDREKTMKIEGSPRAVVAHESHWYIQVDTGHLIRWDPHSSTDSYDSSPVSLNGKLVEIDDDERYLTRSRAELRLFENGRVAHSRVFQDLRSVQQTSDGIFILEGNRRILRLDTSLSVQFTYEIPPEHNIRDFALNGDRVALVGDGGLFYSKLDESERSFFSSTQSLTLQKILGTIPRFFDHHSNAKIWSRATGRDSETVYIRKNTNEVRRLRPGNQKSHELTDYRSLDQLPVTPYQYFKSDKTFWDGRKRLYHFFQDDRTVEAFNSEGQIVRKASLEFTDLPSTKNLSFLGADSQRILFEGEVIGPNQGFQRSVFIFNWEGQILRIVTPRDDSSTRLKAAVDPRPVWKYGADGYIYVLYRDAVVRFDLWGYPEQTIESTMAPVDILRNGDKLYLLDLEGNRLSTFEIPRRSGHVRFATPPGSIEVDNASPQSDGSKFVFAGTSRAKGGEKQRIFVFNRETLEYETVFEHPRLSLEHPLISAKGDTLFFWGQSQDQRKRLYVSDLQQFSARPTDVYLNTRGSGVYDPERKLLVVPIASEQEQYAYVEKGKTTSRLRNSQSLQSLTRGGFTGYFGVEEQDGQSYIRSGFLTKESETVPWAWNASDTIARIDQPIQEILYRDGNLHLITRPGNGFSQLGKVVLNEDSADTLNPEIQWKWLVRGHWSQLAPESNRPLYLVQNSSKGGYLAQLFPGEAPTGGIQGKLISSAPSSLSNLTIRSIPGGNRFQTEAGGHFSADGLPTGYTTLFLEGHKNHFRYPVQAVVHADEFQILSDISVEVERELLLLERGIRYFNEGDFSRARITLEAYRNLVEEGAYYRYAGAYLEEVYSRQGRYDRLYQLYRENPRLFQARDRYTLFEKLEDNQKKREIIKGLEETWISPLRQVRTRYLNQQRDSSVRSRNTLVITPIVDRPGSLESDTRPKKELDSDTKNHTRPE